MKFLWRKIFNKKDKVKDASSQEPSSQDASENRNSNKVLKVDKCWQESLGLKDDFITEAQLEKINTVRLFEKSGKHKTSSLAPIFAMPNLKKLTLTRSYTQPVNFRTLSKLSQLRDLRIGLCDVTMLEDLKAMNFLNILDISNITIKTADLKPINDFPNLKRLAVCGTNLRSMKIFQGNDRIERLIGSYSKGIKDMTNLDSLFLLLKDQVDISNCPNLRYLRISRPKKMTTADNLADLTSLKKLELINLDHKMDITALPQLVNLEDLYLDPLMDLDQLSEPMESVLRLPVIQKNRSYFEGKQAQLSRLFPNAQLVPYASFMRFLDI